MRRLLPLSLTLAAAALGQAPAPAAAPAAGPLESHTADRILKAIDDLMWHTLLGDIAHVDKVAFTSLPPAKESNPTAQGAGNPVVVWAYTYIPRKLDRARKHPLLVYVHGGVHANHTSGGASSTAHILRELLEQGYVVIAPDYRGSTGYGRTYWELIDYGGRENDDCHAARAWALERFPFLDPRRVGMIGWSHGGMITLMSLFQWPEDYAAGYAGVPVSDLVARMGYKSEAYRRLFSAPYHIGKDANDNVQEYLKRSPLTHAAKLKTPLLLHANTNDEDVSFLEVDRMATALKAAGKMFEYKVYQNAPGGHHFNRIDTKLAGESRAEIWAFLKKHLRPGE